MNSISVTSSNADDTDSPSSLNAEAGLSDSQELLLSENTKTDGSGDDEDRKLRRFNRRKALALERSSLPAPKLGRVLVSANNTIDLTNEDDDPSNKWFKKTFNAAQVTKCPSPEEDKKFAVPRSISKNAPKSLLARETLKKKLQASMSAKRRKEQEQRRKMYEEDNEHLKPPSDEEEEEEIIRKKKVKKSKPSTVDDEYNSEDDEDYQEEDSPPENSSDEEDSEKKDSMNSNGRADDEMSVNLLNDSFTYDVFNNVKRPGPGSTVSNFDSRSQADEVEKDGVVQLPSMNDIVGNSDVLNVCSFSLDENGGFPDTLQMLLGEGKNKTESVSQISDPAVESDDDEELMKKRVGKNKKVIDSDDEDDVVEETPIEDSEKVLSQDVFAFNEEEQEEERVVETLQKKETSVLKRIVLSGDEDSEDEQEDEEDNDDEVLDENDQSENEENADEPEEEPNFDDEDDELAVIKRLEHQEYKKNVKKRTLFDDEASLSGDDVGSEDEDDDGNDAYEAEEGDADEVPDDDTIRRQNYKLLLKQENDKEQRALAKLQDRLLADGDLGGVETNRQFRFKLREELDVQITAGADEENDQEEDEPEESEADKKARADMIKYRIEHASELMLLDEQKQEDDDMFAKAAKIMRVTDKTVIQCTEEITIKSRITKPSLLAKNTLANSFQEILSNGAAPKQMYVQNYTPSSSGPSTSTSAVPSSPSSRLGAVKRGRMTPDNSAAKRLRSSKLSSLE